MYDAVTHSGASEVYHRRVEGRASSSELKRYESITQKLKVRGW